jgi:uncharacterized coiled-coil DUF342 family protein
MSDTPETDSAFQEGMSCKEVFEFARRLERERDEARQQNVKLEKQIEGSNNFANERFEEIQRVRRERDEAREKVERQAERIRTLEGATNHAGGLNGKDLARRALDSE